jgi:hypothetical protein
MEEQNLSEGFAFSCDSIGFEDMNDGKQAMPNAVGNRRRGMDERFSS